jgi:hypothetical protein
MPATVRTEVTPSDGHKEGNTLTPDELEQFIREYRDEGELFDYKDGAVTKKRKEGRHIIRK